jgi:L-ribulose-5-phosphate 3-epimerase
MQPQPFQFDISLAQWSLHKRFFNKEIAVLDFARIARERYAIGAVEYVNQFFSDKAQDKKFLQQLKQNAQDAAVKNVLIMIDHEGELASAQQVERMAAVEKHKKWVEAAAFLGCDAVRVNLHGFVSEADWVQGSCESLQLLGEFAQPFGLNVLVENHGGLSANINLLVKVMRAVNAQQFDVKNIRASNTGTSNIGTSNIGTSNIGTMPDFGNFCIRREVAGDLWLSPCVEQYDPYLGVEQMLPFAGAISAKTFHFDAEGNERDIDFRRLLQLIKQANYSGYIGIEYEGDSLSEDAGIRATKALLEKLRAELGGAEASSS